jgi:hypothetical protein
LYAYKKELHFHVTIHGGERAKAGHISIIQHATLIKSQKHSRQTMNDEESEQQYINCVGCKRVNAV